MSRLFKKARAGVVVFCDRCGTVCDSVCRAESIREQARQRRLAYGWRQV